MVPKSVLVLSALTALLTAPSTDGVVRDGTAIAESVAPSSEEIRTEVEVAAEPEQSAAASIAPLAGVSLMQSSSSFLMLSNMGPPIVRSGKSSDDFDG